MTLLTSGFEVIRNNRGSVAITDHGRPQCFTEGFDRQIHGRVNGEVGLLLATVDAGDNLVEVNDQAVITAHVADKHGFPHLEVELQHGYPFRISSSSRGESPAYPNGCRELLTIR